MNYPQRMYSKTELGLLYFPIQPTGQQRAVISWYELSVVSPSGTSCNA